MTVDPAKHQLGELFRKKALMNQDTFDLPHLNQFDEHLVFMYGTLRSGYPRNAVVASDGTYIGTAITTEKMMMFKRTVGEAYPVIFNELAEEMPDACKPYVAPVKGELWHVTTEQLTELDGIEGNPTVYTRVPLQVQVLSKPALSDYQLFELVPAWGYVGNKDFWREETSSGRIAAVSPTNQQLEFTKDMHCVQM